MSFGSTPLIFGRGPAPTSSVEADHSRPVPTLLTESEEDRRREHEGEIRRQHRLARRAAIEAGRTVGAWRSAAQEPGLLEEASDLVVVEPVDELGAHPRGARDLDRVAVAESG